VGYAELVLGVSVKKFVLAAVIATAFGSSALAAPPPPPTPVAVIGQAANIGPWIVAGVGFSALSVIVRAAVVGSRQHRDLTSAEAIDAILLPFFWIILTQGTGDDLKSIMGPVKTIDHAKANLRKTVNSPQQMSTQPGTQPDLTIKRPN
jgi:hypothetical protein